MILTAQKLDTIDRCTRRSAFEQEYESRTISSMGLLYAAVEGSITADDPIAGAKDAIMDRTSRLDVTAGELSPISVGRHVESMAEVIALALRARLGRGCRVNQFTVGEHVWRSNLFEFRGELHRIVLCSHMDDDTLRAFAHSWGTIGELAALERPLTLTAVIVGSQRAGRRHSPWAKGFLHPIQKRLRFSPRKKDSGFTENWKTCWREQMDVPAKVWLERMSTDDVLSELIVSRRILYRSEDERMSQAKDDIVTLSQVRARTSDPMRRSACDEIGRGACPWQQVCYSPTPATPEDFPALYRQRGKPLVAQG